MVCILAVVYTISQNLTYVEKVTDKYSLAKSTTTKKKLTKFSKIVFNVEMNVLEIAKIKPEGTAFWTVFHNDTITILLG